MATFFHRRKGGVSWGFGVNRAEGGRKKAKMGENGRWMGGGDGGKWGEMLKFRG
ncbi:hypothetical protein HMPREF1548_04006 [Clostridium sp. KLE 1755]|nr:hypothetical protein HMPREF1548_04006 [Clostridium sp. KLE 1755]